MNDEPGSTGGPAHRSWWDRLGHMFSGEPRNREELVEELRAAQANGLLSNDTLTMVEGALKVTELSVDDVMVPRAQIVMISAESPLTDILAAVVESGHSRFPVHGEDKDEILGILLAKDLLKYFGDGEHFDIRAILRPAVLIPESMRLNVLLAEFRLSRNHMALVVDEYGGVAGLITIEDVLEQIVGDIDDEHD
ncbi:MAG: HlyC/CorC family transporter, partial [Dyella sp.]